MSNIARSDNDPENLRAANFFGSVLKAIACTPNLNPDALEYETGVIEPARRIRELMRECEGVTPTRDQIDEVISLLGTIFETKQVDIAEREDRLNEIYLRSGLKPL